VAGRRACRERQRRRNLIPDAVIDQIRERVDVVAVIGRHMELKRSGRTWKGNCIFHGERTPSFHVYPEDKHFKCYGCGAYGDVFTFLQRLEGKEFPEVVRALAQEVGVEIPEAAEEDSAEARAKRKERNEVLAASDAAARYWAARLASRFGAPARAYLERRGVTEDSVRRFRLGVAADAWNDLAPRLKEKGIGAAALQRAGLVIERERDGGGTYDRFRNRLMFPIAGMDGQVIGFGGRALGDEQGAKYINTPETPLYKKSKVLYGLDLARETIRKTRSAVLVEGYFDVIGLHQVGVTGAVAVCGTALTPEHVELLSRCDCREVTVLFDGDVAGLAAPAKAAQALFPAGMAGKVAVLPSDAGKTDPDEYARANGRAGVDALLGAAVPLSEFLVDRAVGHGVRNVVIGMAHRGRLNVLANVVGKPLRQIFAEFRDNAIVNAAGGDVKYHLGHSTDRETPDGVLVHLSLAFNPSHLEWIDTVVQGRVRAKQDRYHDFDRVRSLPVLVHGDAAFAGQGIVAEALNMSQLEAYGVGGTIHVIVNNQVGFTTSPRDARSTTYCTGPARMLQIPIIHVNGEDLEAVAQAVLLAADFRQRFHRDVVIDLWAYRRHGHNEGDEPSFTQPVMYRAISKRPTLRQLYAEALEREGTATRAEVDAMAAEYRARLDEAYQASAQIAVQPGAQEAGGFWAGIRGGAVTGPEPETGVAPAVLAQAAAGITQVPQGFRVHPKLAKVLEARAEMGRGERPLDWGTAEALAFATLALEGRRVRLVGQDSRRGTFSHRHAVLYDHQSGTPYSPLAHLREGQGVVEIRDSLLSEAAALGYEYGYSLEMPDALTLWEAQFGDFVNAAQVIIDQFLSSGEAKWNRLSGLALLLPHGMEGQGPEHSSARLERFLELSVDDNWYVVNVTTPAQYFHALRRQVHSPWRKPLVVMSPKSLLRHPKAVSPLGELAEARFRPVIADPVADPSEISRVVLCSGKLYYDLAAAREAQGAGHVALIRLEQLYPLHADEILDAIAAFRPGAEMVWAQEEPSNMGAWDYVDLHLSPRLPSRLDLVSRPPSASPAAGSATRHKLEQQQLVREALGDPVPRIHRTDTRAAAHEH
jgi:2-oxoglutarate dehydrogenase E1 component